MLHRIAHKLYNGHRLVASGMPDPYQDWTYYSTTGVVGFPNNYYFRQINGAISEYSEFTKAPELGVDTNLNVVTSLYLPHDVSWYCDIPDNTLSSVSNMINTFGHPYLINGEPQTSSFKKDYYSIGAKVESYACLSSNGDTTTATFHTLGTPLETEREYPTYGLFSLNDSRFTYTYNNLKTYVTIKSSATVSSQIPLNLATNLGVRREQNSWISSPQGFNITVVDKGNNIYELYKDSTVEVGMYAIDWTMVTPIGSPFYVNDEFLNADSLPTTANSGQVLMDYHFISGTWRTEGYYKFEEA